MGSFRFGSRIGPALLSAAVAACAATALALAACAPVAAASGCERSISQGGCYWAKTTTIFLHGYNAKKGPIDCNQYWGPMITSFNAQAQKAAGTAPQVVNVGFYFEDRHCEKVLSYQEEIGEGGPGPTTQKTPIPTLGAYFERWLVNRQASHPNEYVNIVAHSMGGLIVRYALKAAAEHGASLRIDHVVTLDTPHTGTPVGCSGFFDSNFQLALSLIALETNTTEEHEFCDQDGTHVLEALNNYPARGGSTSWATIGVDNNYCWMLALTTFKKEGFNISSPPECRIVSSPFERFNGNPYATSNHSGAGDAVVPAASQLGEGSHGWFEPDVRAKYTGDYYDHETVNQGDWADGACEEGDGPGVNVAATCPLGYHSALSGTSGSGHLPAVRMLVPLALAGAPTISSTYWTGHNSEMVITGTGFGALGAGASVQVGASQLVSDGSPAVSGTSIYGWSDTRITLYVPPTTASCSQVKVVDALGLASAGTHCLPPTPAPAPAGEPPNDVYIGLDDHFAAEGGPAATITGTSGVWHASTCSHNAWHGARTERTEGANNGWSTQGSYLEDWATGIGTTSGVLWWTAGTGVLTPWGVYAIWADVDTCNAGTTSAWYTVAGEDGRASFASDSGQRNVQVDQAATETLSGEYDKSSTFLGEENVGEEGITVALVNGGANHTVGASDIKLERLRIEHPEECNALKKIC